MRFPFGKETWQGSIGSECWKEVTNHHLPPCPGVRAAPARGITPGRLWGSRLQEQRELMAVFGSKRGCGGEVGGAGVGERLEGRRSLPDVELM